MSRPMLKAALLAGGLLALAVPAAIGASGPAGKIQDRLPRTEAAPAPGRPVKVAWLDRPAAGAPMGAPHDRRGPPGEPPTGPRFDVGMEPPFGGPPRVPPMGPFMGPPDPLRLARTLTVAETAVGIRADQLDIWRAYTDALQAVMAPPPPEGAKDPPAPLAWSADVAARATANGEAGGKLAAAVEALKGHLTPDQLSRLAHIEPLLMPPPPPPGPAGAPGIDPGSRPHPRG